MAVTAVTEIARPAEFAVYRAGSAIAGPRRGKIRTKR